MVHSKWYDIARQVEATLQGLADERAVKLLVNPALPLDMGRISATNKKALFLIQRGDKLLDKPGQRREKRQMRVVVGAVSLTPDALADADDLHFAARDQLRSEAFRVLLRALGDVSKVDEVEIEPELKEMAVEGTVLLSAFEIEYFQQYPSAA